MAEDTKIEWATHTFNPWLGCSKVSPACKNCYAEAWAKRSGLVQWGDQAERRRTSESYWRQPLKWNKEAKKAGERRRVFCASLADVFEDRDELREWRYELFCLINETPNLDWLLLTKRPENISRLWPYDWIAPSAGWPNIWIGTTVENQEMADKRIPELLKVPAVVRFLSVEPLLGPIQFNSIKIGCAHRPMYCGCSAPCDHAKIDWVICGGESGPNARPMHPDWARSLRDQCTEARVPFHFKQWGEWKPLSEMSEEENNSLYRSNRKAVEDEDQDKIDELYGRRCKVQDSAIGYGGHIGYDRAFYSVDGHFGMQIFKVGKKGAGRLLDGVEWSQFPEQTNDERADLAPVV